MTKLKQLKASIYMNKKQTGLILTLAGCLAGNAFAGTLNNYTNGDVLVCFRSATGYDLVVDAGQVSTLTNLSVNQSHVITQFNGAQLAYVGTNSVTWSAFAAQADNTLFMSRPRTAVDTQTTPWSRGTSTSQHNVVLDVTPIITGVSYNLTYKPENTSTAVVEDDNSTANPNYPFGLSYANAISPYASASFKGDFQGNIETTTLNNFTQNGQVVRADFYQLTPGSGPGTLLGYFELNTNGVVTYVAYPISVPVVKSVARAAGVSTLKYTTGVYGTYTLRATNSAGLTAPRLTWPAVSVLTSGNTTTHTVTDTTADDNRFYTITAQ